MLGFQVMDGTLTLADIYPSAPGPRTQDKVNPLQEQLQGDKKTQEAVKTGATSKSPTIAIAGLVLAVFALKWMVGGE